AARSDVPDAHGMQGTGTFPTGGATEACLKPGFAVPLSCLLTLMAIPVQAGQRPQQDDSESRSEIRNAQLSTPSGQWAPPGEYLSDGETRLDWHEAIRLAVDRHPSVAAARANLDAQSSLV